MRRSRVSRRRRSRSRSFEGKVPRNATRSRKRFRERLRKWRRKRRLTQEELAKRADVPKVSASHFETGLRFPNAESLRRLADALGVSADYLLGRVRDPVGGDIIGMDPEVAVLWRLFQGMSGRAREQMKQLFEIVDAMDRKRHRSRERKA